MWSGLNVWRPFNAVFSCSICTSLGLQCCALLPSLHKLDAYLFLMFLASACQLVVAASPAPMSPFNALFSSALVLFAPAPQHSVDALYVRPTDWWRKSVVRLLKYLLR